MMDSPTPRNPSIPARACLLALRGYKTLVSPWLPSACRFAPSCSQYAMDAVLEYGAFRGGWLGLKRLLRCHPFHPGGLDPVEPRPRKREA